MFFVVRGALAAIAIGVCSAWAAELAAPAPAVQLLQTGWKASAGKYAAAQRQYDQARHNAPRCANSIRHGLGRRTEPSSARSLEVSRTRLVIRQTAVAAPPHKNLARCSVE